MKKLLLIILTLFLVIPNVSAVSIFASFWTDGTNDLGQDLIINDGESAQFHIYVYGFDPYSVDIVLRDLAGNQVGDAILDVANAQSSFMGDYTVDKSTYTTSGDYKVHILADDGYSPDSEVLNLEVKAIPTNTAPILAEIGNKVLNEGELLEFTLTASDEDNDDLTLTATNLPDDSSFLDNGDGTGLFTWQTDFDDSRNYEVTFTASDSDLEDSETITITVIDVEQPTVPVVQILSPVKDQAISGEFEITWAATDEDQDDSTLDVKVEYKYDLNDWVVLEYAEDNNDGGLLWDTTTVSDATDYSLRITVTDNDEQTAVTTVSPFTIDNPYSPNIDIIAPEEEETIDEIYTILWTATDDDQYDNLLDVKIEYRTFEEGGNGGGTGSNGGGTGSNGGGTGSFINNIYSFIINLFSSAQGEWIVLEDSEDNNDGVYAWDTTEVEDGDYQLRIIITDDDGNEGTEVVNLFSIDNEEPPENHDPEITSLPITNAVVNQLYEYDVEASDEDNDVLSYSLTYAPEEMGIDAETGLITWIPTQDDVGNNLVVVLVGDGNGGFAVQPFKISVTEEPTPVEESVAKIHKFSIANIMFRKNNNFLDLYVNIRNDGNRNEKVTVKATLMQTGYTLQHNLNLGDNDVNWETIRFNNLKSGKHVVKVEVFNRYFKDVSYSVINV